MKLNGDIAKIWKHTFSRSPIQLLGSRLLHLFPTEKSAPQTFFHPPIFSLSIHVPSPSLLCFLFQTSLLPPKPFSVRQSSPSLYVFQVPLFYASIPDDPLMPALVLFLFSLYSYQPLKLNLLKRIQFRFFYFPSFFQKSGCFSPFMQDLLFPYVCSNINSFFLTKYFSYLFECTYLSES